MAHRESQPRDDPFRPSKRYIPPADNYREGDYLKGIADQKTPVVGQPNASPVRGKRHVTTINPHHERERLAVEKEQQAAEHNRLRGERLAKLEHRNEYINGFGGDTYVTSKKVISDPITHMGKETHQRDLKEARFYTEQRSARSPAKNYSSSIGYVDFDYSSGTTPTYAANRPAEPPRPRVRENGALTSSRDFLAIDPETAPRNVSPPKKLVVDYQNRYNHGGNILSHDASQAPNPPPRRQHSYEHKYKRDVDIISNTSTSGSSSNVSMPGSNVSPYMNSRRYAARDAYTARNSSNPISHENVLGNIPTAAGTRK